MRYHAVGPNNTTGPNRDSLENACARTDPRALAYPDRLYVLRIGGNTGEPVLETSRVAVVIGDTAVRRYQDVVFDDHFPVARDHHIVPDERPTPDAQCGIVTEPARRDL